MTTFAFTTEPADAERTARIAEWLADIPDDAWFFAYWYEVPWKERRSVRDRSRLVTRRKQRR